MVKMTILSSLIAVFAFPAFALSGPLSASPGQVMLPTAQAGQDSTVATLRLVNDGGPIMGLQITNTCGNNFVVFSTCPYQMDPSDTCTVQIKLNTFNSGIFTCRLFAEAPAMPPLTVSIWGHVE